MLRYLMPNKSLTLTIVIPVFNEQDHIETCLTAIAGQSDMPDEVIVVDNNSTDDTLKIAGAFPFVKLLKEHRQGVLFAKNKGFKAAAGQIIARIDADTILPPRWVSQVKNLMAENSTAAITGPVNYYDMPFPDSNHHPDHWMRASIYNWSPKSPFLFGSNMAIRKSVWESVRKELCSDTYMHEDLDLAIHLYKRGHKIVYSRHLLAGASGRRYNDSPKRFYKYISMYRQTYLRHGLHSLAIYSATGVYALGYVVLHPWLRVWYRLYSAIWPLVPLTLQPRKNPMNDI
ncbi:MAG TPA: glycosyltransferase family A protein [Candidatus Saccharimonadales bacterium]|nr:glycosyltransferase family A protein [Candidatus Saccharimonadales bacterium]